MFHVKHLQILKQNYLQDNFTKMFIASDKHYNAQQKKLAAASFFCLTLSLYMITNFFHR